MFLFGTEEGISNETKNKLSEEQKTHGDIILVNGFVEHYNNLTLKTLYTLKFFLQTGKSILYELNVYEVTYKCMLLPNWKPKLYTVILLS